MHPLLGDIRGSHVPINDWLGTFFWKVMKNKAAEFVRQCEVCQRNKTLAMSPVGLLQPLLLPYQIWEDLTMDFIEGLPLTDGVDTILVVVDCLSKYSHFLALRNSFTAKNVAEIYFPASGAFTWGSEDHHF